MTIRIPFFLLGVLAFFVCAAAGCTCSPDDCDDCDCDCDKEDTTCDHYGYSDCREDGEEMEIACVNVCNNDVESMCDYDICYYGIDGCMIRKYDAYIICAQVNHCETEPDYITEQCFLDCHEVRAQCVEDICDEDETASDEECFKAFDECKDQCYEEYWS